MLDVPVFIPAHHVGNPGANTKSISHIFYLLEVAFVWELTKETIVFPLGLPQERNVLFMGLFPNCMYPSLWR